MVVRKLTRSFGFGSGAGCRNIGVGIRDLGNSKTAVGVSTMQDWRGSVRAGLNAVDSLSRGLIIRRSARTSNRASDRTTAGLRAPKEPARYGLTEKDSTGLNHTWFRKNENRAGRWTSPDPYNGSASVGNPQSWNRYSYVENQPTNFVDPSGLVEQVPRGCVPVYRWSDGQQNWVVDYYLCASVSYTITPRGPNTGPSIVESGGESPNGVDDFHCWTLQDVLNFLRNTLKEIWEKTKNSGKENGGILTVQTNGQLELTDQRGTADGMPNTLGYLRDRRKQYSTFGIIATIHTHPSGTGSPSGVPGSALSGDYGVMNNSDGPPFGILKFGPKDTDVLIYNKNGPVKGNYSKISAGCWSNPEKERFG
ncbi:MAG: hypothetical protein IPK58_18045 [Acidobacteria bacterium]|nr:hypothetical protein [Acidobacteriota bacterium]